MEEARTGKGDAARVPGDSDVWFFIIADICGFSVIFVLLVVAQTRSREVFEHAREQIDLQLGLINTIILLSSGALVAKAVKRAREGDWVRADTHLKRSLLVGSGFAIIKLLEWSTKVRDGIGLTTNEFFAYYFALTGIHFLHYLIGCVILSLLVRVVRSDMPAANRVRWFEAGAAYWHMVDLLWICLLALLYFPSR